MLEVGVGHISWSGDDRLSAAGVVVVCCIATAYYLEVRYGLGTSHPAGAGRKAAEAEVYEEEAPFIDAVQCDEEGAELVRSPFSREERENRTRKRHHSPTRRQAGFERAISTSHDEVRVKAAPSALTAGLSGLAVLVCSVSLVYTNAWILRSFPYVCTYITVQQLWCFAAASVAVKWCGVVERVELDWRTYLTKVAPLGICFTLYLWGSNTAYRFLEPGLVQMLKSIGSCFVFVLACFFGAEEYTFAKALNFFFISCGTVIIAAPQILASVNDRKNGDGGPGHGRGHSRGDNGAQKNTDTGALESTASETLFGVCVLIGAYFCDAYYIVSIQRLQDGDLVAKCFGPLATLMYVSPIVAFCLLVGSLSTEREAWAQLADVGAPLVILACVLAFAFNIAVLNFIGRLSAITYLIFDYFKDFLILSVAFCVFSEDFSRNELFGYAVVLSGASVWQHRKLRAASSRDILVKSKSHDPFQDLDDHLQGPNNGQENTNGVNGVRQSATRSLDEAAFLSRSGGDDRPNPSRNSLGDPVVPSRPTDSVLLATTSS